LYGAFLFRHHKENEARSLLSQSLKLLEKRKHVKTITKFAQMEYNLGDSERGRTIFEGVVESHPKRLDLWSMYLDMEATKGDLGRVRSLFERMLSLKISQYKARSLFKRWLALEVSSGDAGDPERVKQRAMAWKEQHSADD